MTDRWWAPQRATVEPDAVVLAMLEPGDIGSSMLAVHRAGAAAIDTVTKSALPSEARLIDVMARARSAVANRVVDSVAKSASPSYAGLFVMDVFDDAEEGALSIYRTAVSKGVAPPIAAQRAADVFGVPAKLMGKYAVMATDPRANPVAVRDLADRTLLEHVSHVVTVEQPHEEISKANGEGQEQEAPRAQRPWREADVVRDAMGRFADESGNEPPPGSLEAIRRQLGLTGAPANIAGEAVAAPQERQQRQKRRTRRTRRERVTRVVATGQKVKRKATRATVARGTKRADPRVARQQAIAQRLTTRAVQERREQDEQKALDATKSKALTVRPPSDMLAPIREPQEMARYELDTETVLRMGLGTGAAFRSALLDQARRFQNPNEMIFRAGYLMREASPAEEPGTEEDEKSRRGTARVAKAVPDYAKPSVTLVNVGELGLMATPEDEEAYVESERDKLVKSANEDRWRSGVHAVDEDTYIEALPVYRPYGIDPADDTGKGQYAIVHHLPPDPKRLYDRAIPTVEEYVVIDQAMGNYEGPQNNIIELDPNQLFRVVYNPALRDEQKSGQRVEKFWDAENNVIVDRWYLESISEEELHEGYLAPGPIEKADEPRAYQPRPSAQKPWRESEVVRDAMGRFAEEPDNEEGAAAQRQDQKRRTRRTRRTRVVRAADAQRATVERGREVERTRTTTRSIMQAIQQVSNRAIAERVEEEPDKTPILFDQNDFKVFTQSQWEAATELFDDEDKKRLHWQEGGALKLDPVTRRAFAEITVHNLDQLPDQLSRNVDDDPALEHKQFEVLTHMAMPVTREGFTAIGHRIDQLFKKHPKIDKLEIIRRGNSLQFAANMVPVQAQRVVEVDPEINWGQPVFLRYVGEYRARNLGVRNDLGHITALVNPSSVGGAGDMLEGAVPNPTIHLYRLTTQHYRATN